MQSIINRDKFVRGTHAPCDSGFWVEYHNGSLKHHKQWFCANVFNRYISGTT
jgi:hypothetical protein